MAINSIGASFGLGGVWAFFLIISTSLTIWKANMGFSLEFETNEQLFLGLPRYEETSLQKLSRILLWISLFNEFMQFLALAFVSQIGWPTDVVNFSTAAQYVIFLSSYSKIIQVNFLVSGNALLILFWIVLAFQLTFCLFYLFVGILPFILQNRLLSKEF